MSQSVALFDPNTGSFATIIDGALKVGATITVPVGGLEVKATTGGIETKPVAISTPTLSSVASSATNVAILAANANRRGAIIVNDSTSILYLKFGATASTTSYSVKLNAGETYKIDAQLLYTGLIHGIWSSANGNAYVTELT